MWVNEAFFQAKKVETWHLNSTAHIWWIIFHLDVQLTTRIAFDAHVDCDQEREERLNYLDQYSCRPPPFFLLALSFAQVIIIHIVLLMITVSLMMNKYNLALPVNATLPFQIGVFVYHVLILTNDGKIVGPNGPAYIKVDNFLLAWSNLFCSIQPLFLCQLSEIMPVLRIGHPTQNFVSQGPLIFNPRKKKEIWRFLTYQFVHSGYFHICFNILVQVRMSLHKNYNLPPIILCDSCDKTNQKLSMAFHETLPFPTSSPVLW